MRGFLLISAWVFVSLIGDASVAILSLWPLYNAALLRKLLALRNWRKLYSLGNSNLDVLVLVTAHTLLHAALVLPLSKRRPRDLNKGRRAGPLMRAVFSELASLLLLGKAVAVAMLADDDLAPSKRSSRVGLIALYASITAAWATVLLQTLCAARFARLEPRSSERAISNPDDDAKQPLLAAEEGLAGPSASAAVGGGAREDEDATSGKGHPGTVWELVKLALHDTHILVVAFTAGALAAWGQALIPYYTGESVDAATVDERPDWKEFHHYVVYLLYTAAGTALFTAIRGGLFTIAGVRVNTRLRNLLFKNVLSQDISFFDVTKTGELTSRMSADTTTVADQVSLNVNILSRCLMQAALVLVFMFSASWRLTVVTFILIPVNLHICKNYAEYYKVLVKNMQTALAEANVVAEEAISSMATVRAHAGEIGMAACYAEKLLEYYRLTLKAALAYAFYMSINTFLPQGVAAVVLLYGGHLVFTDRMSAGGLIAFMLYQQSLASAFNTIGDVFTALTAAVGAADKVVSIIHRKPRHPCLGRFTCLPTDFKGKLELRGVHFAYPARPDVAVLRGVDFTVEPGEIVALVGPSGSGKSSIVKLLLRFYVPSVGAVLVDGRDVGDYDMRWLRRHVAIVGQEPVLYGRSIYRNIVFGLEDQDGLGEGDVPTRDEVIEAAKLANAHGFIMEMPDGYDTQCGDKGTSLSGGQKQRIAIARALVRKPAVLLLDEATSALDAESEAVVQEALERVMRGRTVLVIAHRLSTVQSSNRIIVMTKGAVAESGTQQELEAANGVYASLVRRQMRSPSCLPMTPSISPHPSTVSLSDLGKL